jgi:hypothetical protein
MAARCFNMRRSDRVARWVPILIQHRSLLRDGETWEASSVVRSGNGPLLAARSGTRGILQCEELTSLPAQAPHACPWNS